MQREDAQNGEYNIWKRQRVQSVCAMCVLIIKA